MLLELESYLKENIDKGLTVWLEPVGDRSKLRNLRGIKIKPENNQMDMSNQKTDNINNSIQTKTFDNWEVL